MASGYTIVFGNLYSLQQQFQNRPNLNITICTDFDDTLVSTEYARNHKFQFPPKTDEFTQCGLNQLYEQGHLVIISAAGPGWLETAFKQLPKCQKFITTHNIPVLSSFVPPNEKTKTFATQWVLQQITAYKYWNTISSIDPQNRHRIMSFGDDDNEHLSLLEAIHSESSQNLFHAHCVKIYNVKSNPNAETKAQLWQWSKTVANPQEWGYCPLYSSWTRQSDPEDFNQSMTKLDVIFQQMTVSWEAHIQSGASASQSEPPPSTSQCDDKPSQSDDKKTIVTPALPSA